MQQQSFQYHLAQKNSNDEFVDVVQRKKRLSNNVYQKARKEIATKDEYKYVVENDDVMAAKDKIAEIIKNHQTNQG